MSRLQTNSESSVLVIIWLYSSFRKVDMSWWSVMLSLLQAGRSSRHGSSRRWLPSLTFLLTQQYTISSLQAGCLVLSPQRETLWVSSRTAERCHKMLIPNLNPRNHPMNLMEEGRLLTASSSEFLSSLSSPSFSPHISGLGSVSSLFKWKLLTDLNVYKPSLPVQVASPSEIYRYLAVSAQSGAAQVPSSWMSVTVPGNLSS